MTSTNILPEVMLKLIIVSAFGKQYLYRTVYFHTEFLLR